MTQPPIMAPVVYADLAGGKTLMVRCPHCGRRHFHTARPSVVKRGMDLGWFVGGCARGRGRELGYFLIAADDEE